LDLTEFWAQNVFQFFVLVHHCQVRHCLILHFPEEVQRIAAVTEIVFIVPLVGLMEIFIHQKLVAREK